MPKSFCFLFFGTLDNERRRRGGVKYRRSCSAHGGGGVGNSSPQPARPGAASLPRGPWQPVLGGGGAGLPPITSPPARVRSSEPESPSRLPAGLASNPAGVLPSSGGCAGRGGTSAERRLPPGPDPQWLPGEPAGDPRESRALLGRGRRWFRWAGQGALLLACCGRAGKREAPAERSSGGICLPDSFGLGLGRPLAAGSRPFPVHARATPGGGGGELAPASVRRLRPRA